MPYIDWAHEPPAAKTSGITWSVQLLSDGTMVIACGRNELRLSAATVDELCDMADGVRRALRAQPKGP